MESEIHSPRLSAISTPSHNSKHHPSRSRHSQKESEQQLIEQMQKMSLKHIHNHTHSHTTSTIFNRKITKFPRHKQQHPKRNKINIQKRNSEEHSPLYLKDTYILQQLESLGFISNYTEYSGQSIVHNTPQEDDSETFPVNIMTLDYDFQDIQTITPIYDDPTEIAIDHESGLITNQELKNQ